VNLSEHIRMVMAGLKYLRKMFAKESPPDATSIWLSCVENLKRSSRALAYDLQKDVDFEVDSEFMLYGKDLSVFNQILPHFLRNSIDHGLEIPADRKQRGKRPQGRIQLRLDWVDEAWQCDYKDDGRGIDAEKIRAKAIQLHLITDEVAQLDKQDLLRLICHPGFSTLSEATEISGRGVGMDAIKKMVEDSEGTLQMVDTNRGGTHFRIRWKPQEKTPMRQWSNEDKEAILIVDDEAENAEILLEIIRRETKRMILCAQNGKEALEILGREPVGLVLTDIRMPNMSGWQFLSEVLKNYEHIPILVMTGDTDEDVRRRVYNLGVNGFLEKPLDYQALRSSIRQALALRRRLAADEEIKRRNSQRTTVLPHLQAG
jgi:CheY-like chemotaxis protein